MAFKFSVFLDRVRQNNTGLVDLEQLLEYTSKPKSLKQLHSEDVVDFTDCLSFLVNVICKRENTYQIHKAVLILQNLAESEEVRSQLHHTFNLCSPLAALFSTPTTQSADQGTITAILCLLQRITYGHYVEYQHPYIDQLVIFLLQKVLSLKKCPDLAVPVLGCLVNLCRNNPTMQKSVKTMIPDKLKSLLKTLCGFFENEDKSLEICSIGLYVMLSTSEPRGEETRVFFAEGNLEFVLQVVFNILKNNFKTPTWRLAADLLSDILVMWEDCVVSYQHLAPCLKKILCFLSTGSKEQVSEVLRLLLQLSSVRTIRPQLSRMLFSPLGNHVGKAELSRALTQRPSADSPPLLSCVYWAAQTGPSVSPAAGLASSQAGSQVGGSSAPCLALDFLSGLIETGPESKPSDSPVHLLMPGMSAMLSKDVDSIKTESLLKLVTGLCEYADSLHHMDEGLSCATLDSLFNHFLFGAAHKGQHSVAVETNSIKRDPLTGMLRSLSLASKLEPHISGVAGLLVAKLKESKVQSMLGQGLCASDEKVVAMAIHFLLVVNKNLNIPTLQLCSHMAAINKRKDESIDDKPAAEPPYKQVCRRGKENMSASALQSNKSLQGNTSLNVTIKNETNVEELIQSMNSLEPSGVKSVFEHHVGNQKTKDEQWMKLLEAKTLQIRQADSTIAELHKDNASKHAELKKLFGICQQSEQELKRLKKEMSKMVVVSTDHEEKLETLSTEKKRLEKESEERSKRLASKEKEIEGLKQELASLEEKSAVLEEDLANMTDKNQMLMAETEKLSGQVKALKQEKSKTSKELKEALQHGQCKEEALQKLGVEHQTAEASLRSVGEEKKEVQAEKEALERSVNKLRSIITEKEAAIKNFSTKVSKQEREIEDKETKIKELQSEYEKFQSILSFINTKAK